MPPEDRFVCRFAAEPPQDPLPYGRWSDRLRVEFLAACLRIDDEGEDLGKPGDLTFYPDRSWNGRTYVPVTAYSTTGYELYGYVTFPRERAAATRSRSSRPPRSSPRRPPRPTRSGSWTSATPSSGRGAGSRARRR
jgi:hypothetical protein